MIRPTFEEWEDYCRETAAMAAWDSECEAYLSCTFGCDVWGGSRDVMSGLSPPERYEYLMDTKVVRVCVCRSGSWLVASR